MTAVTAASISNGKNEGLSLLTSLMRPIKEIIKSDREPYMNTSVVEMVIKLVN